MSDNHHEHEIPYLFGNKTEIKGVVSGDYLAVKVNCKAEDCGRELEVLIPIHDDVDILEDGKLIQR